jgi:hypothetical protein
MSRCMLFEGRCRLLLVLFCLSTSFLATGCTMIKGVSLMRGGVPESIPAQEESIQADQMVHFLTVKVRINDSQKDLNFMVDTGAITVIDQETDKKFTFKDSVTNGIVDSSGNKKDVSLVQVDKISVGSIAVRDCAAAVIDLKKLSPKIDGILGSNFLKHFIVQLDYRNKRLNFLSNANASELDGSMKMAMWKNMKFGFAPTLKCEIDGSVTADCMVDTGHAAVASFPLSSIDKLPHFKSGEYISSTGPMGAGVFGKDSKNYLVKTDKITSGPIVIDNAAILSNQFEDVATLGAGYLRNFLVTIDYPGSLVYLKKYDDQPREKESFSYGFGVAREKGKNIVTGVWKGCAADKAGLSVGDELLTLDGQDAEGMALLDVMQLMKSTDVLKISYLKKINGGRSELTLNKEDLTLLFPRSSN